MRRLLQHHVFEQPHPGVYCLVNHPPTNHEDVLEVQMRVEDAGLCLLSAPADLHAPEMERGRDHPVWAY
ncbi:hypothetical protein GCM10008938_51740 [Deinococcus roseus]|uniref:Uncharacterized protein n=1 Tax=Deinococcus roseus TaxID=392414 RepID=A0ABQ2DLW5_9DEIO|nr:hypothetical protein GCM10008938_51740 [Deinococcus roseus]